MDTQPSGPCPKWCSGGRGPFSAPLGLEQASVHPGQQDSMVGLTSLWMCPLGLCIAIPGRMPKCVSGCQVSASGVYSVYCSLYLPSLSTHGSCDSTFICELFLSQACFLHWAGRKGRMRQWQIPDISYAPKTSLIHECLNE